MSTVLSGRGTTHSSRLASTRRWMSSPTLARPSVQFLAATGLYLFTASVLTWPLVLHVGSALYLSPHRPYGDYTGTMADVQSLVSGFHIPFLPGHVSEFNAPNGLPVNWGYNLVTLPESMLLFVLTLVFGAVAAFDLFALLGFVASGVAMFGLVRMVTRRNSIALLAGWAFAFYPYAVANGEHPDYINAWPLALMLWAGLRALDNPTRRTGAVAGVAAVLALAWTPYYLLLGGVAFTCEVAAAGVIGLFERRLRSVLTAFGIALAIVFAYLVLVLVLSAVDPASGAHSPSSINDVVQQSARPTNYLYAPSWNFLLGRFTGSTLVAHGWDTTEHTLYLGLSLLALALVAVIMALRGRLSRPQRHAVVVAGTICVVAALCSGPPQWTVTGHYLVNMPSWYLYHLTDGFRIYERFVIVVELGLCVVAAMGIVALLPRGHPKLAAAVIALISAVVVCDLWAPIPNHFEALRVPAIYSVLARQPPGVYADYPLGPAEQVPDYHDIFYQAYARHPVLNGYPPGSVYDARALSLANLADPRVGGQLAALGVKYVLLERHPLYPFTDPGPPTTGFVELAQDSYAILYRNDNRPTPLLEPVSGFSLQEGDPASPFRWIDAPSAQIRIQARCTSCRGVLTFGAMSFAQPRKLVVADAATGKPLLTTIVASSLTVRVPIRFDHQITLVIAATPGPQSIHATTGSPDQRSVSVSVENPRFLLDGERYPATW